MHQVGVEVTDWNTGDQVVDSVLQQLESLGEWRTVSDPENTHQFLTMIIRIEQMLPAVVSRHFKLPNPFVGNAHFDRSQEYRRDLIARFAAAINLGLVAARDDPSLRRESNPDFSDRPKSKGEEILDARKNFMERRDQEALTKLKQSVISTRLQSRVATIEMLSNRKRPYHNQPPEIAMLGELHRLEDEARGYFGEKA